MNIKEDILVTSAKAIVSKHYNSCPPNFFIISSGRSGTTLLRKLLVNSKQVYIPPESNDWLPKIATIFTKGYLRKWENKMLSSLSILQNDDAFKFWNVPIEDLKNELIQLPPDQKNFYGFIEVLYTHGNDNENLLIGDKTPYLVLELKWIKTLFPNAKIIHLVRDSRAVVASRMKHFSESIEQATDRWVWAMKETDKHLNTKTKHLEIRYEDLVTQPLDKLQSLCSFLEIKYTNSIFKNKNIDLGDTHLSHHEKTAKPLNKKSINKWQENLKDHEIKYIYDRTKKWLIKKNYD